MWGSGRVSFIGTLGGCGGAGGRMVVEVVWVEEPEADSLDWGVRGRDDLCRRRDRVGYTE